MILTGCANGAARFKIYRYNNDRGLFVRSGDKDVLRPEEAHGFLCVSQGDLEKMAHELAAKKSEGCGGD
jgi:hypothetical protein